MHHLLPGVDLLSLPTADAHEKIIKCHAKLGEYDCRLFKVKSDDPAVAETRTTLMKDRHISLQFMQVLELTPGVSILFAPEAYNPPTPASSTPISVTLSSSSGDVATSAVADMNQNHAQTDTVRDGV